MKKELFDELTESIKQAGSIRKGVIKPSRVFNYHPVAVKRLRSRLHFSQSQFALLIGVNKSTLQNWEQGRRKPEGPAKVLLTIVNKDPRTIIKILQAS